MSPVPEFPSDPLRRAAPPRVTAALVAMFAASGCAALIYQLVWFQLLSFAIGASALSLGVLLATFLGGMCIGSVVLARVVSARRHPLRVYAVIEAGIALFGVAALHGIPALGNLYVSFGGAGTLSIALRLVVAALCLLPATILMGATLPAVARWPGRETLGFLYAANTAGAVVGSVLAGFYLLRAYDAQVATFVAAAMNLGVAALAVWLASRTEPQARSVSSPRSSPLSAAPTAPRWPLYSATALSGATALSAEVIWTRDLSLLFGGTVYTFALILAVFLLGLGIGSAAGAALARRVTPRLALCACQLVLCSAMAWAAWSIARWFPYWSIDVTQPSTASIALQLDLLRTALAILPAALLWGASFPLALAAASARPQSAVSDGARRDVGRVYAANTLGAIVGSLATTFVLIPYLGTQLAQGVAIAAAACSAGLLLASETSRARVRGAAAMVFLAVVLVVALVVAIASAYSVPPLPPALVAYGRFLPTRGVGANVVYVGEGLTASIAVTREPSGILTYHNAGKTQASTYPQDLRLQRMLGHIATLSLGEPRTVLVIGLGAGITAGAVSVDPAVERVVVAEIEPLVPSVAAQYFSDYNFGVVTNPKVEIRIDDGRHLLATTREKFDAITSDPLDPWVKGAAALYTREFWRLVRSRLNEGGVVTVFLQLYESSDESVKSEIATFFEAFPNGALLANTVAGAGYDAVLLGRAGEAPLDLDGMQSRLESAAYGRVAASLREVGIDSALDLVGTYSGQAEDLAVWLADAAINTDRNLRLQYLAGEGLNAQRAQEIFSALRAHDARFPDGLFTGSPARLEELRQRIAARHGAY